MSVERARPESVPKRRIRPLLALRALRRVLQDPDDTESGARLVMCLEGNRFEQGFQRFADDPFGARLIAEGDGLESALGDREALRRLPDASLGRAYLEFMEEEGLTAEGLERSVEPALEDIGAGEHDLDAPRRLYGARVRLLHDVWHVATGYSRDLLGELQLLAFSHEQLRTRAYGWMIPLATIANQRQIPEIRSLIELARARARRAPWLPTTDWVARLASPLDEVRQELRLGAPPRYVRHVRAPNGRGLVPEAGSRPAPAA